MFVKLRRKGYYKRITKIILILLFATILAVTLLSYFITRNILLSNQLEKNKEMMDAMEINIDTAGRAVRNFCEYMYMSEDVQKILNAPYENMEEISTSLIKIHGTLAQTLPYFHSMQIYNGNTGEIYYIGETLKEPERQVEEIMEMKDIIRRYAMIYRSLNVFGNDTERNVFSCFVYDSVNQIDPAKSFMAVNIELEWLEDDLRILSGEDEQVLLYDRQGKRIGSTGDAFGGDMLPVGEEASQVKIGKEHYIVTKNYLTDLNLYIVKLQQSKKVLESIHTLKIGLFISGFLLFLLSIFFGGSAAGLIYKPINRLYKSVGGGQSEDELEELDSIYRRISKDALLSNKRKRKSESYILSRLIRSGSSMSKSEMDELFFGPEAFVRDGAYVVFMMDIDDYDPERDSQRELEILKYALINMATEVIEEFYINKGVSVEEGKSVIILQIPGKDAGYEDTLKICAAQVKKYMAMYFQRMVSVFIGRAVPTLFQIDSVTERLTRNFVYKYNFEPGCCITEDMIEENLTANRREVDRNLVSKLIASILDENEEEIKKYLVLIVDDIKKMNYQNEMEALIGVVRQINDGIKRLDSMVGFDYMTLIKAIMKRGYLSEVRRSIEDEIILALQKHKMMMQTQKDKNMQIIADGVKEKIDCEFSDSRLCTVMIADELHLPSRKISKIFKDIYGMSITEYITQVRLEFAARLLIENKFTVMEVARKVGFENEAYFYRQFKERYKMTPKQYVYERIVNHVKGEENGDEKE